MWLPSFVGLRNGTKLRRGYSFSVNQFSQNGFFFTMAFGGLLPPLSDRSQSETHFYPSALRAGGVLLSRSGRADGRAGGLAGGCQTCGTHIFVTAWRIFSIRSFVELSRPLVVHCHGHLPICPIWAFQWAKNLSNLPQIGSRLWGSHISWNRWMDVPRLKFGGLVWTCSCALS